MTANVQHSSASNEHYTPPEIVEAARATMGGIDLDPFSCREANKVVRARQYYTAGGFTNPYHLNPDPCYVAYGKHPPARVFCNPPGGALDPVTFEPKKGSGAKSSAALAWRKLFQEWIVGHVEQAIFVCFNLEVLRHTQNLPDVAPCLAFPVCFVKERLKFWNEKTPIGTGQPSHPNAVVYLPSQAECRKRHDLPDSEPHKRFRRHFGDYGYCINA